MGLATNHKNCHLFVLEVNLTKLDGGLQPSYHLAYKKLETTPENMIDFSLHLLNFINHHVVKRRQHNSESSLLDTAEKKAMSASTEYVCNVFTAKPRATIKQIFQKPVIKQLYGTDDRNITLLKSASIAKKVTQAEYEIYSVLLQTDYSQYLPHVLNISQHYVETEYLYSLNTDCAWTEIEVLSLLVDVTCAIRFLHSHNIIHRDVKPANIMLRQGWKDYFCYVLIDFGEAIQFETKESDEGKYFIKGSDVEIKENVGSGHFKAPEVQFEENYTETVDIYSLGATAMALLNPKGNILSCWTENIDKLAISAKFKDLLKQMVDSNKQRPNAQDLEISFSKLLEEIQKS